MRNTGDPIIHGYITADAGLKRLEQPRQDARAPILAELAEDARYLLDENQFDTDDWRIRFALSGKREIWRQKVYGVGSERFPEDLLRTIPKRTHEFLRTVYGNAIDPKTLSSACALNVSALRIPTVLLIARLLDTSIRKLFAEAQTMPAHDTKWPCKNANSRCNNTLSITGLWITLGRAHFACPHCYCTYSRSIPLEVCSDGTFQYKYTRFRPGPAWRSRLLQLWNSGKYNVDEIAKTLHIDRRGLLLIAGGAGLQRIKGGEAPYRLRRKFESRRLTRRRKVEEVVRKYPLCSRPDLIRKCKTEINWLRLWDPLFIRKILPSWSRLRNASIAKSRIDQEDAAIRSLEPAAERIKMFYPPKRITAISLLNASGIRAFSITDELRGIWPRAVAQALLLEENHSQFGARRVTATFAFMVANGNASPTWKEIFATAKLTSFWSRHEEARAAIVQAYEMAAVSGQGGSRAA